ncbi:interleukin-31 receptor subunit alpha [Poecilia reticulata]|uniref:Interleukin-31 receptor subunit alpha-like n=2 Tax=Poecilia reticulata TaxID=8081 RepID=A0A3P9Q6B9_POERE|nr:PREDICTED: interleukin-31 receptor subunit alpha-like [Poecilia reticulata]
MSGRGVQSGEAETKYCWLGTYTHVLVVGLMLVLYAPIFTHVHVSAEKCKPKNISTKYQHCGIHPDGVHNLDCFRKFKNDNKCTWESGKHGSKSYTFILQQADRSHCVVNYNITKPSRKLIIYDLNFTVEVIENNAGMANCTKAVFSGSKKTLKRSCGPPNEVLPTRTPGGLQVNVTWLREDGSNKISVRYRALGSHSWNETVESQLPNTAMVEKLTPSLVYVVQIQCVTTAECTQCPWSKNYYVPSELTTRPILVSAKYTDITQKTGCRLISITWKFPVKDVYDGYRVTVWKESGEPPQEQLTTSEPAIRLTLSYSAYRLNISAYNNASVSPAATHVIPQHTDANILGDGRLNVTVHNSTAFTIHWRPDRIRKYVCYVVEWMKQGHSGWYLSFFEDAIARKTVSSIQEHLEPYTRYRVTLHLRPNKNTCNMKHINNSESTYGTTEFYHTEGSPVGAPANVTFHNVTLNSAVLQWSQIPEEDLRGFLLGYIIYYTEHHYQETSTAHNITVDPGSTSFHMEALKSGTAYQVQISGFTLAGEGIRSISSVFKTDPKVNFSIRGAIAAFVVVACLLVFGSPVIKRVKAILWPRVPNPGHSNAVQKIESPGQLKLLEALVTLKAVEEWDTKSFQILEREAVIPSQTLSMLPHVRTCEDDSLEMAHAWSERDGDSTADNDDTTNTLLDTQRTHFQSSPFTFAGGYTTMEMFQQLTPQWTMEGGSNTPSIEGEPEDFTVLKSMRLDYVRQFSTSPPSDSEFTPALV